MNINSLVSIIVPVYNVENYLERCINSLIDQTYTKLEILLVDDGSTDKSGSICDAYAEKDLRIRVFHKKNGGLSDARNFAIDRASGDYYTFVDSDDYVDKNYVKALVDIIRSQGVLLSVVGTVETFSADLIFIESKIGITNKLTFQEAMKKLCLWDGFGTTACGKMFHKSLFSEIRYPKGKLYEDMATTPWLFELAGEIGYCNSQYYYYYQRSGSIMNSKVGVQNFFLLETHKTVVEYFGSKYPELNDYLMSRAFRDTARTLIEPILFQDDYYELMTKYRDEYKEIIKHAVHNPLLSKMRRIQARMILDSLSIHKCVFKIITKIKRKKQMKKMAEKGLA